ncbi:SusC/RagA family TonB-linked outer membrane protein [Cellvibrio sp. PSBB006]|uniref:SusC/RagA family TonB-linked outer membrane protein n=1 Tax=Cellvibrio sp. PSBB006 TaxID=1987723 RepID=UPI000B3B8E75|nr:SusC/RagA family TonB-linked outer membrane protein [Cellvibrio sp. PSBB006]ARU26689.1 SusC/RagA family protein [Cellvibrio sp. PSBB006]
MNKKLFVLSALFCAVHTSAVNAAEEVANGNLQAGAKDVSDPAGSQQVEEVVVVGYSTSKKQDITGAVAKVELDDVVDKSSGNLMQNLQGRIPGVQITTNGSPSSNATVRIRGQGLGVLGYNDPLYVIDGVPTNSGMHELNSNDIESVSVLRDAASASIYGARAANGVIIITTKKGQQGTRFDLKVNQSHEDFDYDLNPLTTQQRAEVVWRAAVSDGSNPNNASSLYSYDWNGDFSNPELYSIILPTFIDGAQTMRPANTNWFNEVTRSSTTEDINLSLSSADEDTQIFGSVGFFNREGIVDGSKFERLSARLNSEQLFLDGKIKVGENFTITNQEQNLVNDLAGNILGLAIEQQSIVPVRTEDGMGWGGPAAGITDRDNPVRIIAMNRDNVSRFNKILGNIYIEASPVDNLVLRSSYGINYGQFKFRNFTKAFTAGSLQFDDRLTVSDDWNKSTIWSSTAKYSFVLGDLHGFDLLIGTETVDFESEFFSGTASGFASQDRDYAYLSQGTSGVSTAGSGTEWTLKSYFTKLDYDYDARYLASVTVRRDGSSRFGENNQWGNFPAISAGWRISEESFFSIDAINELKLRASWGQNGNQEINTRAIATIYESRYATPSLFTNEQDEGTAYDLHGVDQGVLPSGFAKIQTGNPDLKWETSTQTNFGVDFDLFSSRVYGSIDWFEKRTEDILTTTQPLAAEGEGAQMIVNGGTIDNTGVELMLGYIDEFDVSGLGVVGLDISGNISTAKNKVVDLPAAVVNSFGGNGQDKTILGESINSVYGYVADGLFQSQEEIDDHAQQAGAGLGRIRYKDLNNDGVINDQDQDFFATTDPDFIYGMNFNVTYKKWDFNMFWQGVHGGQIKNHWRLFTDFTSLNIGSNYGDRTLDAWTPENSETDVPALTLIDNNNEGRESSFYWESASYLKLRNLSIGYTFENFGFESARVYLNAENLITITPSGTLSQDPEAPNGVFPIPRRITLGVSMNF